MAKIDHLGVLDRLGNLEINHLDVQGRIEKLEVKIILIDKRIEKIEERMRILEAKLTNQSYDMDNLGRVLEKRLEKLEKSQEGIE